MGDREEQGKGTQSVPASDRQSAQDATKLPPEDGSLKVHGDKLEKLIPKGGSDK